jgi:hypothetical protein
MPVFANATNPRLLTRLLEQVAAGTRRSRAIAEVLGVEVRIAQAYLLVAGWLRLTAGDEDAVLTPSGLDYVYGGRRRAAILKRIVAGHPVLGPLSPAGAAPTLDALADAFTREDPRLPPTVARKRAAAIRRLCDVAWRTRHRGRRGVPAEPRPSGEEQLTLGFASPRAAPPRVDLRAGTDDNPDVYALVLRALLDAGEVTPAHVRGILDAAGAEECGIGGYLAMAERRGDARRVGESLVVTRGAITRADLAESAVSVALSDPEFRRWLTEHLAGRPVDGRRFRAWTNRLFGADAIPQALERLLFGRPLHTFPVAGASGEALGVAPAPFLEVASRRDLPIAFPSSLLSLGAGLAAIARSLREGATAVRAPGVIDRRAIVHGGLLYPGEPPPRSVPDMVSLRTRAIRNTPAFAILCALCVLDRRGSLRLRVRGTDVLVEAPPHPARTLDTVVAAVAGSRGWVIVRGPTSAPWGSLVDVGEQIGLFALPCGNLTIEEGLFHRLQADPEYRDLWDGLRPLADLIEARVCR